jgi:hypothetical protein
MLNTPCFQTTEISASIHRLQKALGSYPPPHTAFATPQDMHNLPSNYLPRIQPHTRFVFVLQSLFVYFLLLFLTAVGVSPGGSSLTPVQTPQYNNTHINGTAQLQYTYWQFTHTVQCAYTNTIYLHNTIYPHITKYLHKYDISIQYNIPTQIQIPTRLGPPRHENLPAQAPTLAR